MFKAKHDWSFLFFICKIYILPYIKNNQSNTLYYEKYIN